MKQSTKKINDAIKVFSTLMIMSVDSDFKFPKGGAVTRTMEQWIKAMEHEYGIMSQQRIIDYCVTQVYFIQQIDGYYDGNRWKPSHAFSSNGKCWERFQSTGRGKKYYEDIWLKSIGTSRANMLDSIADKSVHPLEKFIFPEYEESSKERLLGTIEGYYICELNTLLFTPFSKSCNACSKKDRCIERTQDMYPELYRLRMEKWNKGGKQ